VCFIASTIVEDPDTLKIFAKKLKKNNIAIDLICFGDCSTDQRNKVDAFIQNVNQEDNSHSIFIEPGDIYLSEKLLGTNIFNSGGAGNVGGMEVDDPELAEAIRMSLQESIQPAVENNQAARQEGQAGPQGHGEREQTEEELEQLAISLSLEEGNQHPQVPALSPVQVSAQVPAFAPIVQIPVQIPASVPA
jgi:26S proteasome regulatory subunit N10